MKLSKISSKYLRSDYVNNFVVSLVAGVSAFFWAFFFMSEYSMLDLRINLRNYINESIASAPSVPDERIVVVYLSEATIKNLKDARDINTDITSRKYLASLVSFIAKGKPAVIGLDHFLEDRDPEKGADDSLVKAIASANTDGVSVVGGFMLKPKLTTSKTSGNESRRYFDAVKTKTFLRYDEDGVLSSTGFLNLWQQKTPLQSDETIPYVRYYYPVFEQAEAMPRVIINEYRNKMKISLPSSEVSSQLYINYRHPNPETLITVFDSAGMENLMAAPPEVTGLFLEKFKDKIVLIGNAMSGNDMHLVPVNDKSGIFGVLIHALILKNYLDDDFIVPLSSFWKWLIILFTFAVTSIISLRSEPKRIFLFYALYLSGFISFAFAVFYIWSLWIPIMPAIITQLVTLLAILIIRIAISEKDNLDAADYLGEYIPEKTMVRLSEKIDESLFTPFKDDFYVIAGWAKNLPYSEEYNVSDIKRFIDDYHTSIKNIVFDNGGCFNILPQNGFMAFWPAGFYDSDQFERVLSSAESIRAMIESLNYKAAKQFKTKNTIYIDIVILEDTGYVGCFSTVNNGTYTVVSDSISGVLQIPWLFSSDEKNLIIFYEDIKNKLDQSKKTVKLDRQVGRKDIYELE